VRHASDTVVPTGHRGR